MTLSDNKPTLTHQSPAPAIAFTQSLIFTYPHDGHPFDNGKAEPRERAESPCTGVHHAEGQEQTEPVEDKRN